LLRKNCAIAARYCEAHGIFAQAYNGAIGEATLSGNTITTAGEDAYGIPIPRELQYLTLLPQSAFSS